MRLDIRHKIYFIHQTKGHIQDLMHEISALYGHFQRITGSFLLTD
jgi:hypothetical protein